MEDTLVEIPDAVARLWAERPPEIVRLGNDVLRQQAQPVRRPTPETRAIVDRMKASMRDGHGVGLAAPQIGVAQRIIVYQLPEEGSPLRVILNPKIVSAKGEQVAIEGCLSIPYLHGEVPRAYEVIVKGMDMLGRPLKRRASDMEARVLQHEIDHLDGVLFIDRADPATLHWDLPQIADLDQLEETEV